MPRKDYTIAHSELVTERDRHVVAGKVVFPETKAATERSYDFTVFAGYPALFPHFANAFYACAFDKRSATRKGLYGALRRFFEFLDFQRTQGDPVQQPSDLTRNVFNAYRQWLLARQTRAGAGVHYNATRRVVVTLRQVSREAFGAIEVPRFGMGPESSPRPGVPLDIAERVLVAAREEARSVWETFERGQALVADAMRRHGSNALLGLPVAAYAADLGLLLLYICEVYGGVVPLGYHRKPQGGKYDWRLIEGVSAHGGVATVSRYLYATAETLAPFLLLVGNATWANAEALLQFRRDCLRSDEVFPYRVTVVWDKPRAGREQRRSFDRRRSDSVPRLIEQVLALTERLVPFARMRQQGALFLTRGARWIGIPAIQTNDSAVNAALDDFAMRHGLKDSNGSPLCLRLSGLRPTAMKRELQRGRDVVTVQHLANHRFLETTVRYVDDIVRKQATDAIAFAQETLYGPHRKDRRPVSVGTAERPGLTCTDPANGRGPGATSGQLCPNWLAELLNPFLIVPGEPKYVARLLQARAQVVASQERMLARRFELLYRPFLEAIEDALAHFNDPVMLEQAGHLAHTLPPLIRLEIA